MILEKFLEFIGNVLDWIMNAIKTTWHLFKVIVTRTIKLLKSFMNIIGDFIKDIYTAIRDGLKKIFVIRGNKNDFKTTIEHALRDGKVNIINTDSHELFDTDTETTKYDYSLVLTNNNFDVEKVETISADELDKKIGQRFKEEVSEITIK